ncbi:MAG: hypothetical protein ABI793_01295 [Flavobacterium sp.]
MKKLYINTAEMNTIFNDLKDSLNGTLTLENNQYKLKVNSKKAKGTISGMTFNKQMAYMEFDVFFHDDVVLSMESSANSPVLFAYCSEGNLSHSFGINGDKKDIKPNQTGILRNTSNINSVLFFKGFKRVKFSLISNNVSTAEDAGLSSDLKIMFTNPSGKYIHVGPTNGGITEKINEFTKVPQKGIVGNLVRKRILENILEIEHMQHSYGYVKAIQPILNLATKQLEEFKRISNLNILETFYGMRNAGRYYLPRFLKQKYHLTFSHIVKN